MSNFSDDEEELEAVSDDELFEHNGIDVLQGALRLMNLAIDIGVELGDDYDNAEEDENDFGVLQVFNAIGDPLGEQNLDEHIQAMLAYVLRGENAEPDIEPHRQHGRYSFRAPYSVTARLHQTNWFERSLLWDNKWFRRAYRMSRATFNHILRIISDDPIFQPARGRPQRPVLFQFGVFILRYGCLGSNALEPAMKVSVGEGTVHLYCRRVVEALNNLNAVSWPNAERKEEISEAIGDRIGIQGVVGIVDATHTNLTHKPSIAGDAYLDRKKSASISIQATCDHQCRFTSYTTGHPGSVNDKRIWSESSLWRNRDRYFQPGEFILGDAGYPTSTYLLRPFAQNEVRQDLVRRRQFNRTISNVRVLIECSFGRLKARFPSMALMGTAIDMNTVYLAAGALLTLHNLCYDLHDTVDGLPDAFVQAAMDRGGEEEEDMDRFYDEVGNEEIDLRPQGHGLVEHNILRDGQIFREQCVDIIVGHNE